MSFPIHGFLLLELVVARQPQPQRHQPQMSYVSVPSVPEPASYLRPLLREARDLALSAGDCYEACFVAHVDSVVRSSAARAWAKLDANSDGRLDLEELSVVVKKPSKKGKSKTQKRFAAELWPFLYVLANHFATMDLSRSARVSVSSMENQTTLLLESVKFLDERKALFDEVAGPGVGDEDGAFSDADWQRWLAR